METILIVDDDDALRGQMKWALRDTYNVVEAPDRPAAMNVFEAEQPKVVLLDLGLPPQPNEPTEGLRLLADFLARSPSVKVIIISGQSERAHALEAIGLGAYDFLNKPTDEDLLGVVLGRAFYVADLEIEYRGLQRRRDTSFEGMLGCSAPMEAIFSSIRRLSKTDAPVLIQGESGTGKEMAALAIHQLSGRVAGPFVAINCGAIPEALVEGELFGHEKGSFTGAHAQRIGRFETAQGGTLFLDEIGDLTLPLQIKLLRFLQDRTIERIGGREQIEVDARVIAATNKDLTSAQREGQFREDLYYRLAVVTLNMPPLRDRKGDVSMLATAFLRQFAGEDGRGISGFTDETMHALEAHSWPGNVRELENRVKRAVIMTEDRRISARDLELTDDNSGGRLPSLREAREDVERNLVHWALQRNQGNISRAATELGVSRPTLYELMNKLGIEKP